MKNVFWVDLIERHRVEYLGRFSVGVVGSRMMTELLWRIGVGCIRYVGDFITPNDVVMDVSLRMLDANDYDVIHPVGETNIISYPFTEDYGEMRKQLRGVDLIIAHRHLDVSARIAEELGVPFMPNFITTFLPDGVSFFEVERPEVEFDPLTYSLTCSIQACEVLRLLTGYEMPVIAPKAVLVDLGCRGYLREIELKRLII